MCGRYTQTASPGELFLRFGFRNRDFFLKPRFNLAPGQQAPVVLFEDGRTLAMMQWGLVPSWAREPSIGYKMINARAETLSEKASFKKLLPTRRCLVLADGFYEWAKLERGKAPMRFRLKGGGPFAFAGLWDRWRKPDGGVLRTFTIITTRANELMRSVHDRMPVILRRDAEAAWLDPDVQGVVELGEMLTPYSSEEMESYYVSAMVNSPRNDLPQCIEAVEGP